MAKYRTPGAYECLACFEETCFGCDVMNRHLREEDDDAEEEIEEEENEE